MNAIPSDEPEAMTWVSGREGQQGGGTLKHCLVQRRVAGSRVK